MPPSPRTKAARPAFEMVERRDLPAAPTPPPLPAAAVASLAADAGSDAAVGVTDPDLVKHGGTYYVFSSGPGVEVRASADLVHWRRLAPVFDAIPAWARAAVPGVTSIWAPDVSYFGGQYHLYYAVSTFGSQRSVIGQATNATLDPSSPLYRWVDRGPVVTSRPGGRFNAIDPNVVTVGDAVWLTFGSQWGGIKQVRLDPTTGLPLASAPSRPARGPRALRARAPRPLGLAARPPGQPIEAAYVVPHEGRYYLFVSFDACCRGADSTYRIMVGRSSTVNGPYLDRSGRPLSRGGGTLVLDGNARWRGPGSCGVLSDGGLDWLAYHAYDALNGGSPTLQVCPLLWTPDGWPAAGAPLA